MATKISVKIEDLATKTIVSLNRCQIASGKKEEKLPVMCFELRTFWFRHKCSATVPQTQLLHVIFKAQYKLTV